MLDWRMQKFVRIAAIAAGLLAFAAHGEDIYKWVDKDGHTHYSSRREEAAGAATSTVKPAPGPAIGSGPPPAAAAANQGVLQRGAAAPTASAASAPASAASAAAPDYRAESNAAKCQLARDILAGHATHKNGSPVDAYDRQTAQSDIRAFCGR